MQRRAILEQASSGIHRPINQFDVGQESEYEKMQVVAQKGVYAGWIPWVTNPLNVHPSQPLKINPKVKEEIAKWLLSEPYACDTKAH
jgi:hypothetical protein